MKTRILAASFAFALLFGGVATAQTSTSGSAPEKKAPVMVDLRDHPDEVVEPEVTTMEFEEVSFDFGKIEQGEVVKHTFKFKNTGENDLILESVKPSCGCTALDWPKDPIKPGESAEITAQFNSAGKMGKQMKYITIMYNGNPNIERISFSGEVVPKPAPADADGN